MDDDYENPGLYAAPTILDIAGVILAIFIIAPIYSFVDGVTKMTTDKSVIFHYYWNLLSGSLEPILPEYRFHPDRKWRFDWAFLEQKVAVEVEGNAWRVPGGGRHMQDPDLEKYNNAALLGWRVFRFSPKMLKEKPDECINMIKEALEAFK